MNDENITVDLLPWELVSVIAALVTARINSPDGERAYEWTLLEDRLNRALAKYRLEHNGRTVLGGR